MQQLTAMEVTSKMLEQVLAQGHHPVAFMMNSATADNLAMEVAQNHRKTLSVIGRLWFKITKGHIRPRIEFLHGLPVEMVTHLPNGLPMINGGIFLRCGDVQVGRMQGNMAQSAQNAPGVPQNKPMMEEFVERTAVPGRAAVPGQEVRPSLDDLSQGGGDRPSASDIIMKSLQDADNLKAVIVIRVRGNNDVDMCLNVDHFTAQGILQKAQYWLATRGE